MTRNETRGTRELRELREPCEVIVTAPRMGYGHLRAAWSVARALDVEAHRSDLPPIAEPHEVKTWNRLRTFYEKASRLSQARGPGIPAHWFLEWLAEIPPLHPERDLSAPTRSAHTMERLAAQGFGRALVRRLEATGATLVTTFYSDAIVADRAGLDRVFCVVTDSDVNRVWAPMHPHDTRIRYFVPTRRCIRRLRAFGVPDANIEFTGFPLPPSLVGTDDDGALLRNLAARLARLDPQGRFRERLGSLRTLVPLPRKADDRPPLVVFAIGGAGTQTAIARRFLPGLRDAIRGGQLRLALVAGVRPEVARQLVAWVEKAGLDAHSGDGVRVIWKHDFPSYYRVFTDLLAEADVLWTKPGELVFYAALGLPLVLAPPVGVQERSNARWLLERGAAVRQRDTRHAGSWLLEMIEDGLLAGAAWSGFLRLPHDGSRRIARAVREETPS